MDDSEEMLASHIRSDKKSLFWLPVGADDRTVWALIDTGPRVNLICQRNY